MGRLVGCLTTGHSYAFEQFIPFVNGPFQPGFRFRLLDWWSLHTLGR